MTRDKLIGISVDVVLVLAALALCNLHLVVPDFDPQHLVPGRIVAGEWWRVLSHPFAHASAYHLAIDGVAFLLLFLSIRDRAERWIAFGVSSAGAAIAVLIGSPLVEAIGYGGLSGSAHGVMAYLGVRLWQQARDRTDRRVGAGLAVAVIGKSAIEVASGGAIFAAAHVGSVGTPLVASHLGGALAGALAAVVAHRFRERRSVREGVPAISPPSHR